MTRGSVHGRSTRQADSFETPATHTESGRRRFLHSTVSTYNSLPRELRELPPPPAVRCSMSRAFAANAVRRWVWRMYACITVRVWERVSVTHLHLCVLYYRLDTKNSHSWMERSVMTSIHAYIHTYPWVPGGLIAPPPWYLANRWS